MHSISFGAASPDIRRLVYGAWRLAAGAESP